MAFELLLLRWGGVTIQFIPPADLSQLKNQLRTNLFYKSTQERLKHYLTRIHPFCMLPV